MAAPHTASDTRRIRQAQTEAGCLQGASDADLDRDAEHEAEQQLVILKQAAADIAVEGVRHIFHQGVDTR